MTKTLIETIEDERREAGLPAGLDDALTGRLVLIRGGPPGAAVTETYEQFDVSIIRYLANWDINGTARSRDGRTATFSMALDETANLLRVGVNGRLWDVPTNDGMLRVINAHDQGELSLRFLRDAFSTNEPSWRIATETVLFAKDS